eukprot:scaffold8060_cov110-Cylindrotheca_fusiformis.AAC.2
MLRIDDEPSSDYLPDVIVVLPLELRSLVVLYSDDIDNMVPQPDFWTRSTAELTICYSRSQSRFMRISPSCLDLTKTLGYNGMKSDCDVPNNIENKERGRDNDSDDEYHHGRIR